MKNILAKRKTSSAQAEAPALATASPTVARTKSLGNLEEKDISEKLRDVLKLHPKYPFVSVNSDDEEGESEEESEDICLFMPNPPKPPELVKVASLSNVSGRELLTSAQGLVSPQETVQLEPVAVTSRSILTFSAKAIEISSSDDGSASTPEPLDAAEKSSCKACTHAYHGRNQLGLTLEWAKKLPAKQIDLRGKDLTLTQREQLLALLQAIPDAVSCNLESLAEDDEERVVVDLTELPQFLFEDPATTNASVTPVTQIVREEVVVVKEVIREVEVIKHIEVVKEVEAPLTLAQKNAGLLEKCSPIAIRLLQDGVIQNATIKQKTIARAWILQNLHAISTNKDGAVLIELSEISKQTKVPHKLEKSGKPRPDGSLKSTHALEAPKEPATTNSEQIAITALKGASLIGIGYLLAQLFHK